MKPPTKSASADYRGIIVKFAEIHGGRGGWWKNTLRPTDFGNRGVKR
jgi:hypothetical protein